MRARGLGSWKKAELSGPQKASDSRSVGEKEVVGAGLWARRIQTSCLVRAFSFLRDFCF